MSARGDLLTALTARVPAGIRVSSNADLPDQVDPGKLWVMVLTQSVTPGPTLGLLTFALEVWLLSGAQDPGTVDTLLDDGLYDLLPVLLGIRAVSFVNAERGMTPDQRFHGYKLTVHAFASITDD